MAFSTKRNEFTFLISVRVPNVVRPLGAHRDVGVAAKAPLFEVAVVHAERHQHLTKPPQVLRRLGARAEVGGTDDLHERRARAVEIDDRVAVHAVHVLARVLLHVRAVDADHPRGLTRDADVELALGAERQVVLADLVALGEVGIEVVLAGEDAPLLNRAAERKPDAHRHPHGLLVEHRERARQPEADRADIGVRARAERRRAAAEQLGLREKLRVHLETDDRLELRGHERGIARPRGALASGRASLQCRSGAPVGITSASCIAKESCSWYE